MKPSAVRADAIQSGDVVRVNGQALTVDRAKLHPATTSGGGHWNGSAFVAVAFDSGRAITTAPGYLFPRARP